MRTRPRSLAVFLASAVIATLMGADVSGAQSPEGHDYVQLPSPSPTKVSPTPKRDSRTVLVRFEQGTSEAEKADALERRRARAAGRAGATGYTVAELDAGTPEEAVRELRKDTRVRHAQVNYVRRAEVVPNDPGFTEGDQEYLKTVRLPAAWGVTKGSTAKKIAILDTGIDLDHPDLAVRIRPGYNALTGGTNVADDNGHGTFVAGIASAATNNGRGIAAAGWNSAIMPVKVLAANGEGTDAHIAAGITWAADNGASVINLSLGGPGYSQVLADAVAYAMAENVVVVAAAGNEGWSVPTYPAAFEGVLAVTATDRGSTFAHFSNWGWWVDVAAPGRGIVSTYAGVQELYGIGDGTSFAAPIVSGIALLVRVKYPSYTQQNVYNRVRNTARDFGPRGFDPFYGKGRVDAYAAVGGGVLAPAAQPALDAQESNPTFDRARAVGASVSASISPEGDVDYYVRDLASPGTVTFTVTPPVYQDRTLEMDPVLGVFGPDLRLLGVADNGFAGDAETLTVAATQPGRYYAVVYNFFGSRTPTNYTLTSSVSAVVPPNPPAPGSLTWIRDHAPADFSLNIGTGVNARVEFARDVDPATITTSTVQILNGKTLAPVAAARRYSAVTRTITIDPNATLARDFPYIVSVSGVKDADGNTFPGRYRFRFKTAK